MSIYIVYLKNNFCPPDDKHMRSKYVEAWNKLIVKFSASSWLILINKHIEIQGQLDIKTIIRVFPEVRNIN